MSLHCSICLSEIQESDEYQLQCSHKFHTKCIVDWFRSDLSNGKCPLCNDIPSDANEDSDTIMSPFIRGSKFIDQRCIHLRKISKKSDCPENVKKSINTLDTKNTLYQNAKRDRIDYLKQDDVKVVLQTIKELKLKEYKHKIKLYDQKYKVVTMFPTLIGINGYIV